MTQRQHAILRTFPIIGHFCYWLEAVGPEQPQDHTDKCGNETLAQDHAANFARLGAQRQAHTDLVGALAHDVPSDRVETDHGEEQSDQFGWELRREVGELFRTQVCRSPAEVLDTQESWKAAMIEKGWAL